MRQECLKAASRERRENEHPVSSAQPQRRRAIGRSTLYANIERYGPAPGADGPTTGRVREDDGVEPWASEEPGKVERWAPGPAGWWQGPYIVQGLPESL